MESTAKKIRAAAFLYYKIFRQYRQTIAIKFHRDFTGIPRHIRERYYTGSVVEGVEGYFPRKGKSKKWNKIDSYRASFSR